MAITFDLQDRFQENKVFQTAQTINNIIKSNKKNGSFVLMETVTFLIKIQKNTCLALIIQIMWLKEKFAKRAVVATCYCSIQSYFKIELDLTKLFNVYFLYGKS